MCIYSCINMIWYLSNSLKHKMAVIIFFHHPQKHHKTQTHQTPNFNFFFHDYWPKIKSI